MKLLEVANVVSDEKVAEDYLRDVGILQTFTRCPYCGSRRFSSLRGTDLRCRDCRRAWSVRQHSFLFYSGVSCGQFVMMVKLFEQELSALTCAKELGLSRNTVNRLYRLLREAIAQRATPQLPGKIRGCKSKRGKSALVFGIIERGGKVSVHVVPGIHAGTLLQRKIKAAKHGNMIYTDKYGPYDGLVSHGFRRIRIPRSKSLAGGTAHIDNINGFWNYAKERLQKFHGVSAEYFPLYLKELEARYNSRGEDFFKVVVACLAEKTARELP